MIVLSSYTTFALRTAWLETTIIEQPADGAEEREDEKDEKELNNEEISSLTSAVARRFERVVLDEGHKS